MPIIKPESLEAYLDDLGCDEDRRSDIIHLNEQNDVQGMIRLLRKHRQQTLNTIHKEEKQISYLDYLVFQLENETEAQ